MYCVYTWYQCVPSNQQFQLLMNISTFLKLYNQNLFVIFVYFCKHVFLTIIKKTWNIRLPKDKLEKLIHPLTNQKKGCVRYVKCQEIKTTQQQLRTEYIDMYAF
jgi:hypothetical protein